MAHHTDVVGYAIDGEVFCTTCFGDPGTARTRERDEIGVVFEGDEEDPHAPDACAECGGPLREPWSPVDLACVWTARAALAGAYVEDDPR